MLRCGFLWLYSSTVPTTRVGARDERAEPRDEATRLTMAVSDERRPERSGAKPQVILDGPFKRQQPSDCC